MKKTAIIGNGYVGKSMSRIFPDAVIYDKFQEGFNTEERKEEVNECYLGIVSVPTPLNKDLSCDTSIVEEVLAWIDTDVVLVKSTIEPGTTDRLTKKFPGKRICFSPEYVGEGKYYVPEWQYPHPVKAETHGFMIVGGAREDTKMVLTAFMERLGPSTKYHQTDAKTAEMVKYVENVWGATKVSWANQIYDIAEGMGVDYNEMRELLLLDKRVEPMHTAIFPNKRGWSGKCYPKDVHAFISFADKLGVDASLLKSVVNYNRAVRDRSNPENLDDYDKDYKGFKYE